MDAETIDARYRDFQQVERNFRTLKTGFLEVRPIFLRNGAHQSPRVYRPVGRRSRVFLSNECTGPSPMRTPTLTLDDALSALSRITYLYYPIQGQTVTRLPRPDALQSEIFSALGIPFPNTTARVL